MRDKVWKIGGTLLLFIIAAVAWHYVHEAMTLASAGLAMAMAIPALTEEQVKEFKDILGEIKGGWAEVKTLPDAFKLLKDVPAQITKIKEERDALQKEVTEIRRLMAIRSGFSQTVRVPGLVSDDCARHLVGIALSARLRSGKDLSQVQSDTMQGLVKELLGVEVKTALTSSDIPLPTQFSGEVVELVSMYGTARKYGTVYPLGTGTVKLPRLGTDTAFGLIAGSATVTEKSPTVVFVTFTAEKYGGLVRIPSEIEADSIVALGQFIARYAARQMAAKEDQVFWTGNGSTDGAVAGLTGSTITNSKVLQMATTKTHYSDATLANLRSIRAVPDEGAIANGAYYMHTTFEQLLSGLNTAGDKPYIANGVQGASLDGFPIRWIPSLPAYSVSANINKVFVLFGDVSFQYLGVRGGIRFDTSADAAFATDEILIRALERFTIGLLAVGAVAGLETAAS